MIDININHKITTNNYENNKYKLNINLNENYKLIFSIKSKKNLKIQLNNIKYNLKSDINYNILIFDSNYIHFIAERYYNEQIIDNDIEYIIIHEYGNPQILNNNKYQITYSFDSNYFVGAFTSIYSLIYNTKKDNLPELNLNLFIPENDLEEFNNTYTQFIEKIKLKLNVSLYLISFRTVNSNIMNTKCFKGGNHLLKLSNYSRLIIGHLINTPFTIYIDSDTIIQTDITNIFTKLEDNFIIKGKKAKLNYNNLFNINNRNEYEKKYDIINPDIFLTNIIYTGTLIVNPKRLKDNFDKIINIVDLHNSLLNKGGLYKLFTMSLINIGLFGEIKYFDDLINNVVDLGHNKEIDISDIKNADVLDWSGIYKPWYNNGLYREYWKKYNLLFDCNENVNINKNTIEKFN